MDMPILNVAGATQRTKTTPIPVQRTTRRKEIRVLTSLNAGVMTPIYAEPLLREDAVTSCNLRLAFEMEETVEVLMNSVNVRVMAYLVPRLAFERYDGLDALNKSYMGKPLVDGGAVTPWFETAAADAPGINKIHYYLGKHAKTGATLNTDYVEAYNQIWNFRAKNRSKDITLRARLESATLGPAFWLHQTFAHIVPDFDQAIIDGEVPLNITNSKMPVLGIGRRFDDSSWTNTIDYAQSDGTVVTDDNQSTLLNATSFFIKKNPLAGTAKPGGGTYSSAMPDVWAELAENGITVSLSNIELARKTQAFANLRRQYAGHSDEYIVDLLMQGITIPDEAWKQPMLLADEQTVFGMSKRYASDAANLTESVVNGLTAVDVRFTIPRCPPGGIVMVVAEITPEQLFERQKDPYLYATNVEQLPDFLRDTLDPEKVQVVTNDEVDIDHDVPAGTFGYAPLNHQWARSVPQVGGKFLRPEVDAAFDEDRQRIWAVETANPVLSEDFYLCTTMHYKPFVITDTAIDHFECLTRGQCSITGNTVFGGLLVESTNEYAEVMEEVDQTRIDKPDVPAVP